MCECVSVWWAGGSFNASNHLVKVAIPHDYHHEHNVNVDCWKTQFPIVFLTEATC